MSAQFRRRIERLEATVDRKEGEKMNQKRKRGADNLPGTRINVRLSPREHEKMLAVADELFDGNVHDALRFAAQSLRLERLGIETEGTKASA